MRFLINKSSSWFSQKEPGWERNNQKWKCFHFTLRHCIRFLSIFHSHLFGVLSITSSCIFFLCVGLCHFLILMKGNFLFCLTKLVIVSQIFRLSMGTKTWTLEESMGPAGKCDAGAYGTCKCLCVRETVGGDKRGFSTVCWLYAMLGCWVSLFGIMATQATRGPIDK